MSAGAAASVGAGLFIGPCACAWPTERGDDEHAAAQASASAAAERAARAVADEGTPVRSGWPRSRG